MAKAETKDPTQTHDQARQTPPPYVAARPVGRGKLSEAYLKQLRRIGARIPAREGGGVQPCG